MRLLLDDKSLPIAQMGPDFIILKETAEHPPSDAVLEFMHRCERTAVEKKERNDTSRALAGRQPPSGLIPRQTHFGRFCLRRSLQPDC
jgi:hypothetical protein